MHARQPPWGITPKRVIIQHHQSPFLFGVSDQFRQRRTRIPWPLAQFVQRREPGIHLTGMPEVKFIRHHLTEVHVNIRNI